MITYYMTLILQEQNVMTANGWKWFTMMSLAQALRYLRTVPTQCCVSASKNEYHNPYFTLQQLCFECCCNVGYFRICQLQNFNIHLDLSREIVQYLACALPRWWLGVKKRRSAVISARHLHSVAQPTPSGRERYGVQVAEPAIQRLCGPLLFRYCLHNTQNDLL